MLHQQSMDLAEAVAVARLNGVIAPGASEVFEQAAQLTPSL